MPRRPAPWMLESIAREKELAAEAKERKRARGTRLYAVLPWRRDARYRGEDVIRWFRTEKQAERLSMDLTGGRGVVVKYWELVASPDAEPRQRAAGELERELAEAIAEYR